MIDRRTDRSSGMRRALALALLACLAFAGQAAAKSFTLPSAHVSVRVAPDGALLVEERITYDFAGDFSGGFREIPGAGGQAIDRVAVSEGEVASRPGPSAELGSAGDAGTFGTTVTGKGLRVVWHYRASFEVRTFTIAYRLRGLGVAYDDVVDVNLKVWGDEWDTGRGALTATLEAPGRIERGWGHPVFVRGDVTLDGGRASLRALDVPAGQFVELRVLVPRAAFESTAGMTVQDGLGLDRIVAAELGDAARFERDKERIDDAIEHIGRTLLVLLLLAVGPALAVVAAVWWLYGRERRTAYDREYEQEPPSDTEPALVPVLLGQGGEPGSYEFTATLFDLIRRGRYKAAPVTTEKSSWAGLQKEQVADLELSQGAQIELTPFEQHVADVVDFALKEGPERLSRFRDRLDDDRKRNSERFTDFKEAVGVEVRRRKWLLSRGLVPLLAGVLVFGAT